MISESILKAYGGGISGLAPHYLTLYSVARGLECTEVLEFGCGLSTVVLLEALAHTEAKLTTIEARDLNSVFKNFPNSTQPQMGPSWRFLEGQGLEMLAGLQISGFDLVLHDGSHEESTVREELSITIPLMKKNGLLFVHDTEHAKFGEPLASAVCAAIGHYRHSLVTLPFGYGLTIVRIEEDFGHGVVAPKWVKGSPPGTISIR